MIQIAFVENGNKIRAKAIESRFKTTSLNDAEIENYWTSNTGMSEVATSCSSWGYGAYALTLTGPLGTATGTPITDGMSEAIYFMNVVLPLNSIMSNPPKSCTDAPTQCSDNGYTNAICTDRGNPNEGVICTQN